MKPITKDQLVNVLKDLKGAFPIGISSLTEVKMKAGCPYSNVYKLSRVNSFSRADYANSVNNQREREGFLNEFVAKERKWGKHISPLLVEHKGNYYAALQVLSAREPSYFFLDEKTGMKKFVSKNQLLAWLPEKKDEGLAQGLNKAIICRDYKLDNLVSVRVNKEHYKIIH